MKVRIYKTVFVLLVWAGCLTGAYAQFRHGVSGSVYPWTSEPSVDPENYSFVVVADRTGGELPGIFPAAMENVNLLKPDFVMCIGDLISGYTTDMEYADSLWREVNGYLGKLEAPFFYMGGNHDLFNREMTADWLRRFGATYYYFTVGPDLFLVLNTEDPVGPGISPEQAGYFASVMQGWNGRHVYVFMHRPLWNYSGNKFGYELIEPLLKGKSYTLFSGHEHVYYADETGGNKRYIVATTGGGSGMRNNLLGEFNHLMQVDVRGGQPHVRNLLLSGEEIPDDIVNPETKKLVRALNDPATVIVTSTVMDKSISKRFETTLTVKNDQVQDLEIRIRTPHLPGLVFNRPDTAFTVPPGEHRTLVYGLDNSETQLIDSLPELALGVELAYLISGERVAVTRSEKWTVDYIRTCAPGRSAAVGCSAPAYVQEAWNWDGEKDGRFSFSVQPDGEFLYVDIRTEDDVLIGSLSEPYAVQDKIYFMFTPDKRLPERYGFYEIVPESRLAILNGHALGIESRMQGRCTVDGTSLVARVAVPLDVLGSDGFRLNVGFMDLDSRANAKPSVLWWRPLWGTPADYPGAGEFRLRE